MSRTWDDARLSANLGGGFVTVVERSMFSLDGRVAVVTGASKGIGHHIALSLSRAGANVVAVARHRDAIERVALEIEESGSRALACTCDVTQIESIGSMAEAAIAQFGEIDILVNSAGVNVVEESLDVSPETWDHVLGVNLRGAFFCCQVVGKTMIERGVRGKIISIGSTYSQVGYPQRVTYCASKGGLVQMTRALAVEWAKYGINVNVVSPTVVCTPLTEELLQDEESYRNYVNRIPLGRICQTQDIAGAVVFLSSNASDFITGHNLLVDGGWTAI